MKARFKYRIYPTPGQKHQLAKLFGCVRVVWNDSLACCQKKYTSGEKKSINSELQKLYSLSNLNSDHVTIIVNSCFGKSVLEVENYFR